MKKILSWCGSHTELLCAFFLLGCGKRWLVCGDIILAVYRYVDICLSLTERDFSPYQKE